VRPLFDLIGNELAEPSGLRAADHDDPRAGGNSRLKPHTSDRDDARSRWPGDHIPTATIRALPVIRLR